MWGSVSTKTKLPKPVIYKANNIKTPFKLQQLIPADKTATPASPLRAFPLSVMKFVGTSTDDGETTAYISTPNNMVFQVKKGDILGEHYGKIIDISSGLLKIEEQDADSNDSGSKIIILELKDTTE